MLKRDRQVQPQKKRKGSGLAGATGRGGQSTVEYIILVAAIIGALILFLPGTFQDAFNSTLQSGTNGMEDMADRLSGSRGTQPSD